MRVQLLNYELSKLLRVAFVKPSNDRITDGQALVHSFDVFFFDSLLAAWSVLLAALIELRLNDN